MLAWKIFIIKVILATATALLVWIVPADTVLLGAVADTA
jgi:hypothetical protein